MKTIDLLQKLVSIPSPFPQEKEVSKFIQAYLKDLGFTIKVVETKPHRPNIIATLGRSKHYLGFYGHVDTVIPETGQKDPYTIIVRGNKAYGLGVADMKGGVTAMLQTGAFAVEQNLPMRLIFGVDEEGISEGAHDLAGSKLLNDIDFLIVGESGQAAELHSDFSVCYGRKGRILFEAVVTGKKAHAAEKDKGINAIEQAAKLVTILESMKFRSHKKLGTTQVVIHSIEGQTDSFSVPDTCRIIFSLLTTPNITSEQFMQMVIQKMKGLQGTIDLHPVSRKTLYGESYAVDMSNPFLRQIEKQIISNYNVAPMYATSVADENVFANRLQIPVITLGPVGGGDHTKDEWVNLDSLEKVEQVYKDILQLYHKNNYN